MRSTGPLFVSTIFLTILQKFECEERNQGKSLQSRISTMDEPNPPQWPDSVRLVRPTDSKEKILSMVQDTQDPWNEEHQSFTSDHHFSSRRYAVMFAPGGYHGVDLEVGYYSQVLGLGKSPDDVQFRECDKGPYVPALNFHLHKNGTCLDTFWRSLENVQSFAPTMKWAVSQAAPLRRVHVMGDLDLYDGGAYASGGHFENSMVEGLTHAGGQQQFLYRNVGLKGGAEGGAWSMTYVGCTENVPPASSGGDKSCSVTVLPDPPIRMEKPFVAMTDAEKFELRVPLFTRDEALTHGPLMDGSNEEVRDFSRVRVVREDEPVARIQEALDDGKDVVLAAGIFTLEKSVVMKHPDQVLLGLGLATLVAPRDGSPCVKVLPNTPGVRVAGIMLEASELDENANKEGSSLLEWGEHDKEDSGDENNPGGLFDIFCRVGGATLGSREAISVNAMMRLFSGNVIGDDLWLWRADHAELLPNEDANYPEISPIYWQSEQSEFRVETGLEVAANNVTIYGLAVEHANGHQTMWSGDHGFVAFYQCELPYGVSQETFGDEDYRGYVVHENVEHHELHAPGVYSNFRNEVVKTATAIEHPERETVKIINPFTVRLDNHFGIESISNHKGFPATKQGQPCRLDKGVIEVL